MSEAIPAGLSRNYGTDDNPKVYVSGTQFAIQYFTALLAAYWSIIVI
jgi:hypothetical protein